MVSDVVLLHFQEEIERGGPKSGWARVHVTDSFSHPILTDKTLLLGFDALAMTQSPSSASRNSTI